MLVAGMKLTIDFSYPEFPLTGNERTLEQLCGVDERMQRYRALGVTEIQAPYCSIDACLPSRLPAKLRSRIEASRDLATYGYFCYSFFAVSMFWAVSCVEMALRLKFAERVPTVQLTNKKGESRTVSPTESERLFRKGWRIQEMRWFDSSFRSHLRWAFKEVSILPDDILIFIPEIVGRAQRNFILGKFPLLAVRDGLVASEPATEGEVLKLWEQLTDEQRKKYLPKNSDILTEGYAQLVEIVKHLWDA